MRGKRDAFLLDLAQTGQGEYLESAAVGKHGAIPIHHFVQPTQLFDYLITGTKVEMIGIGQFDLTADFLQIMGRNGTLDRALGTHIHKHRGLNGTMRTGKHAAAGTAFGFQYFKHGNTPLFQLLFKRNQIIQVILPYPFPSVKSNSK